jgi:hypothetical protein
MKWLFALVLALAIFGGAAYFSYNVLFKQEIAVQKEQRGEVAQKMKTTPELIMRTNNMNSTMLRIGERLLISSPDFSMFIQTKQKVIVLINHGQFFKQYHVEEVKLPAKQLPRINTKVADVLAWKNGKRVGFGSREYQASIRWIRLAAPGYMIYSIADGSHPSSDQPTPPAGLGISASDAEELSGLVNGKTPVTITE